MALASEGPASEALPARPQPRRHELPEVGGAVRDTRRPDPRRIVERPAVRKHDLAQAYGWPQPGLSGVASRVPGRLVRPVHESGRRIRSAGQRLGPMRIVYLQYASDAITFFALATSIAGRTGWRCRAARTCLRSCAGIPIVTMLQLVLDMLMANQTPIGYGHVYAPAHYVDAWLTLMDVRGGRPEDRRSERASVQSGGRRDRRARDDEDAYANRGGWSAPAPRRNVQTRECRAQGSKAEKWRIAWCPGAESNHRYADFQSALGTK